jgi:hypothetical protein
MANTQIKYTTHAYRCFCGKSTCMKPEGAQSPPQTTV